MGSQRFVPVCAFDGLELGAVQQSLSPTIRLLPQKYSLNGNRLLVHDIKASASTKNQMEHVFCTSHTSHYNTPIIRHCHAK